MLQIYNRKKILTVGIISVLMLIFWCVPAIAHKVTVFAWAEGDTVFVESKFSGGRKVKQGEVIVSDSDGNQLLTGTTNDEGEFSFKIPQKTAMSIKVVAGMGHQGEWRIPIEDIGDVVATETDAVSVSDVEKDFAVSPDNIQPASGKETVSESAGTPSTIAMNPSEMQAVMEKAMAKALDKKLKSVMIMLDDMREHRYFQDILGGIGYIIGLVGIAAYMASRRKK